MTQDFRSTFLVHFPPCPNKRMGIAEADRLWLSFDDETRVRAIECVKANAPELPLAICRAALAAARASNA